jgi:uncharacterized protein YegL
VPLFPIIYRKENFNEKTSRLPVLDTSGSMHGEPIEAVKNGVQTLLTTEAGPICFRNCVCVGYYFHSSAHQAVPLTDLLSFNLPSLTASGTTALGEALSLIANRIDQKS